MISKNVILLCLTLVSSICKTEARIHKLEIKNDCRRYIALTTFGFYTGGILSVNLTNFRTDQEDAVYGFSLDRTLTDVMIPSMTGHQDKCLLQDFSLLKPHDSLIYLTMDFKNKSLQVNCSKNLSTMHIYQSKNMILTERPKRNSLSGRFSDTALFPRKKRSTSSAGDGSQNTIVLPGANNGCSGLRLPMTVREEKGQKYYNASFAMQITNPSEEGRYNLYFHNCKNYESGAQSALDFMLQIEEDNNGNFLSASEMPLPTLYFMTAFLFFLSGCFWVFILKTSKHPVFKIHYLMAVLVFLKSLSLLFHGINFHFIQTKGEHVAAWAILYYITHLLKGGVLFITIVLIGTGWTFIKYILADKDKKLFMIVIPFQVLANVAEIIIQESEEGDVEYEAWRVVFIIVDLLCCGAIMFPVVWSIRHLEEAAHTDGKAAIHLQKLKLFRHFYIMIVCYIYFTRIIVYLLKITVPFQYEWLDEMFREGATYIFFVLTGYKFRPASANPYFSTANEDLVGLDDDDDDVDEVVSRRSGVTDGLSKVGKALKHARATPCDVVASREEKDMLLNQKESSHEYD